MSKKPTFDLQEGFKLGSWRVQPRLGVLKSVDTGQVVSLRHKAMQVLLELASADGDVVERQTLRDDVWPETLASDESLSRCVADVRAALASDGDERPYIETLQKRGYRLVERIEPPDANTKPGPVETPGRKRYLGIALVLTLVIGAMVRMYFVDRAESTSPPQHSRSELTTAENSIAVLPFVNMSSDGEQAYFADGLSEELMNMLSRIPGLRVAARTSSFSFKDTELDIPEIAARLNVAHVLEGSVRKSADEIRVTAQLIRADNGFHLWSETYDRRLDNIFALQDELAADIARKLQLELGGVDIAPNRTSNLAAYDNYLMGLAALRRRSAEAVTFFKESILHDPDFAPAWASLAIAFQSTLNDEPDPETRAIEAARRALDIDPHNVAALTAMASNYRRTRRWREAEALFERALAIDPGSVELLEDYAEFLNLVGRVREALFFSSRGMDIDPRVMPLVAAYVEALLGNNMPAEAREIALRSMEVYGESHSLWWVLLPLWLLPMDGALSPIRPSVQFPEVARAIEQMLEIRRENAISLLESRLMPGSAADHGNPLDPVVARHLLLHFGEVDAVIDHDIANALDEFPRWSREWLWTPLFESYRAHPRFSEVLALVGLIEYWDETEWPEACRREESGSVTCR